MRFLLSVWNGHFLTGKECPTICIHSDDDRIVSHDAPRFMLYYYCVRDISWSVIFSTREMNIAVLDVDGFETCFGPAASAFAIMEFAYIHCALKENFSVTLTKKGFYSCFTDLSRTTCALGRNYNHKVWDSATDKVHWENRNHDWSQKWLQQNSRYAVKLITKGGFITASRSKELSLQRQLQVKFNLSMRQTILRSTIYPVLTQVIFKEISLPEYWPFFLTK